MKKERIALILGNCLFPDHQLLQPDEATVFVMIEDHGLCEHFKYHKHKLVLFLSAMRSHADRIRDKYELEYSYLDDFDREQSYEDRLTAILKKYPDVSEIVTYDIEDHFFEDRLTEFCTSKSIELQQTDSPGFLTTKKQFKEYFEETKRPFMHTFYQQQRKRLDILVDSEGKPQNGEWSFDSENRKKLPKNISIPPMVFPEPTDHTKEVSELVASHFPSHPGKTSNFCWATTRDQVLDLTDRFFEERFEQFGPYEDAIEANETFIFHSVLSPYINMGLITPKELMDKALKYAEKNDVHFPSVEGFVRQVIGWREFMRGIYHECDEKLNVNYFDHSRKMKSCWYDGTTGIPPLDDSIVKADTFGYTHHIERLMILGNIMLLSEIEPKEVYKWFMEMFVDSSDWVMAPNVYGMSQFSDGGIFATKPYIGGANYIRKMSHYSKGDWEDVVNGLYWRFIDRNQETFAKNPRMSMMVSTLKKMDSEKKKRQFEAAENFISRTTK
ncbi:MAG: cryptochrome/photolyase family protein [Fluviicola sp.]